MSDLIKERAERWLGIHQGEHLSPDRQRLIDRCALFLMEECAISKRAAVAYAVQAWAQIQPRRAGWRIDDCSTPGALVFVHEQTSETLLIAADEIAAAFAPQHPAWIGIDWAKPEHGPPS